MSNRSRCSFAKIHVKRKLSTLKWVNIWSCWLKVWQKRIYKTKIMHYRFGMSAKCNRKIFEDMTDNERTASNKKNGNVSPNIEISFYIVILWDTNAYLCGFGGLAIQCLEIGDNTGRSQHGDIKQQWSTLTICATPVYPI